MRLLILERGRYEVAAIADADEAHHVGTVVRSVPLDFLMAGDSNFGSSARGMFALFQRYAAAGRLLLPASVFHEADRSLEIWQFIKGRLRVFCFLDGAALVVLTHGVVKKTQKADRQEVERAVRIRASYLSAKAAGAITREDWSGGR